MQHVGILPRGARRAPLRLDASPDDDRGVLALHGLRELIHAPIPKLAEALSHLDCEHLSIAVEVLIALLDAAGGDPDLEDCDEDSDGDTADVSWSEWHTRGQDKLTDRGHEQRTHTVAGWLMHECDEEDDPAGQRTEDEVSYWIGGRQ